MRKYRRANYGKQFGDSSAKFGIVVDVGEKRVGFHVSGLRPRL
jgi:hypothetical protein